MAMGELFRDHWTTGLQTVDYDCCRLHHCCLCFHCGDLIFHLNEVIEKLLSLNWRSNLKSLVQPSYFGVHYLDCNEPVFLNSVVSGDLQQWGFGDFHFVELSLVESQNHPSSVISVGSMLTLVSEKTK